MRPIGVTTHILSSKEPLLTAHQRFITERRREVLFWMARGKEYREIAEIMNISWCTARHHANQIKEMYGAPTRMCAVMRAIARGDISLEEIMREFA